MLLKPLTISMLDVFHGRGGLVVFEFRMRLAISLIVIYVSHRLIP
jgi:hypothetical protein